MAMSNTAHERANRRKKRVLELVRAGVTVHDALLDPEVGVTYNAYRRWMERDARFKLEIYRARNDAPPEDLESLTHQQFRNMYLDGRSYAKFQLEFLQVIDEMPLGNIVMALWPPDHGKTTTMENYITEKIALDNQWRTTVASENLTISKKITGRVLHRLEPGGPFPKLVARYGPFKPQFGGTREEKQNQPWSSSVFNVFGKRSGDERDYTMQSLGFKSSIVSTRCDHLHIDDLQSTTTLTQTEKMEEWVRQDALTRPGEYGRTSIVGTRVGEDDVYEALAEDEELIEAGILKVLKFPAITNVDGVPTPLWPERYNMEQLERMKIKAKQEAWDRNYMQNPNASKKTRSFDDETIGPCLNPLMSLNHRMQGNPIVYVGLDPALGGMNCVLAAEIQPTRLVVRQIREVQNLTQNEEIMQQLAATIFDMNMSGRVTDVVIETMNFQAGLARDQRLLEMQTELGFVAREHLTGWNKYDENIGVPSMAGSFRRKEIILPWADDPLTRYEIGQLVTQLKAWKPRKKGSKLRQDRVMALWFVWILWQNRWRRHSSTKQESTIKTGVPWSGMKYEPIVPIGATP